MDTSGYFEAVFQTARKDGILVLDKQGTILRANAAFTNILGYEESELTGRFFGMLFTPADQAAARPEAEIQEAERTGSTSGDAYILHRDGRQLWATGELLCVRSAGAAPAFIKTVHCIGAGALLDQFVLGGELIDTIFSLVQDTAMVVIDTRMSILRSNRVFEEMFELAHQHSVPDRLSRVDHPLWRDDAVRSRLRELIVLEKPFEGEQLCVPFAGEDMLHTVRIYSKMFEDQGKTGKKFLLVMREVSTSTGGHISSQHS